MEGRDREEGDELKQLEEMSNNGKGDNTPIAAAMPIPENRSSFSEKGSVPFPLSHTGK
ncbi:hypothetical protein SESBI_22263 [Sesbania bispinosa]|nr:hypothetical protein SESBI_22263 [Sesbania bispinosa]